jgi:predicted MFS family arabinose efflux permease
MIQVGFILGPVLGAIIIASGGYNYLFSGCMVLCLISTTLSLLLFKDWEKSGHEKI